MTAVRRNRSPRTLGRTGLSVSPVGFGGCAIGGARGAWGYGPTDDRDSRQAIRAALEMGCSFFDTADVYGYGHSEELLGEELAAVRDNVVVATKLGHGFRQGPCMRFEPAYLRSALEASLRRLRTDRVDLLQLHNPPPSVVHDPAVIDALEAFRREGAARWLGVSTVTAEEARQVLEAPWVDTIQVRYHALSVEASDLVFPVAAQRGIGIIAREPLANGFLTGKYGAASSFPAGDFRSLWSRDMKEDLAARCRAVASQLPPGDSPAVQAIQFVLDSPVVSVVIVGCKTASQAREHYRAL